MGGGAPDGGKIKAVQTGGPSGGCIPAEALDTPVDYESLDKLGSIMGSGGMIVMDETTNMVDVARFFMEFCMDESCGKCIPCRAGTVQMHRLLTKILARKATARDLAEARGALRHGQATPASAAWAKPRPTRCSAPCATSAANTPSCWSEDTFGPNGRRSRSNRRRHAGAGTPKCTDLKTIWLPRL